MVSIEVFGGLKAAEPGALACESSTWEVRQEDCEFWASLGYRVFETILHSDLGKVGTQLPCVLLFPAECRALVNMNTLRDGEKLPSMSSRWPQLPFSALRAKDPLSPDIAVPHQTLCPGAFLSSDNPSLACCLGSEIKIGPGTSRIGSPGVVAWLWPWSQVLGVIEPSMVNCSPSGQANLVIEEEARPQGICSSKDKLVYRLRMGDIPV